MANPYLKPYARGLRRAKPNVRAKSSLGGIVPGIAPGDEVPNVPTKQDLVTYGQKGLRRGIPKAMQLRNRGLGSQGQGVPFGGPNAPRPPMGGPGSPQPTQPSGGWPGNTQGPAGTYPASTGTNPWGAEAGARPPLRPHGGDAGQGGGQGPGGGGNAQGGNNMGTGRDTYLAQFGHAFATSGPYAGMVVDAATGLPFGQGQGRAIQQLQDHWATLQAAVDRGELPQSVLDAELAAFNRGTGYGAQTNMAGGSMAIATPGQEGYTPYRQRLRDAGLPNFNHPFWQFDSPEQAQAQWPEFYQAWLAATTFDPNRLQGTGGGVLNDPNGPQNPLSQLSSSAQSGTSTPESAAAAGRDPSKHGAFWSAQGWNQNQATGVWTGPNGATWDQTQNNQTQNNQGQNSLASLASRATQPQQRNGQGNNNQNNNQNQLGSSGAGTQQSQTSQDLQQLLSSNDLPSGVDTQGLPLDATFLAQQRAAEDVLQRQLSGIAPQRESINAQQALGQARLGTQSGIDQQALRDSMAARGTLSSSIYGNDLGQLSTQYLRANQDLSADVADAYGTLSEAASGAWGEYSRLMAEYLLQLAGRQAADPNASVNRYSRRGR